ncbi:MAG TPA: hypothetical protein IAA06_12710 [Candidatus Blautia faecavium]|uniref:Uncharacterized protein n=1 Tax=Candidatus Blautia faecavium TaxID=2838487 RepID=A0A9D2LUJ0_9FIRM|nr:hypothetical protein [Candidatus Blautia faecavium]
MKKKNVFAALLAGCLLLLLYCLPCLGAPEYRYNFQLDRTITSDTTKFNVIFYNRGAVINPPWEGSALYVTDEDGKVLFKKKCTEGYENIRIKKQSPGTILKIFLRSSEGTSNVKRIKVKDIKTMLPEKSTPKIPKRKMGISSKGQYVIYAKKGDTIVIRNKNKVLKKLYFSKDTVKTLRGLERPLEKSEIYVYTMRGKYRSEAYHMIPQIYYIAE